MHAERERCMRRKWKCRERNAGRCLRNVCTNKIRGRDGYGGPRRQLAEGEIALRDELGVRGRQSRAMAQKSTRRVNVEQDRQPALLCLPPRAARF
eukprot:4521670-Pleurochrysis_carterae.AAC.1